MTTEVAGQSPRDDFLATVREQRLAPLWDIYDRVVSPEPRGTEVAELWRWSAMEPVVGRAATAVSGRFAEHRVLLLAHPAFADRVATTPNLLAGVQCVMPGERTSPHHHTAADVRFVLEGSGAVTTVDGKVCPLRRGDLVLTPGWTWHAHANDTAERVVWVDTLDLPLLGKLGASFYEPGPPPGLPPDRPTGLPRSAVTLADEVYGRGGLVPLTDHARVNHSPRVRWPLEEVIEVLEQMPAAADGSRTLRYSDPVSGGAVTPTLDVHVLQLDADQPTRAFRCTGTAICVVIEGAGSSRIGATELHWERNDIFTLPNWTWRTHTARGDIARLLLITDRELYRRVGLLREQSE